MLAEQYKLETIKGAIVMELFLSLKDIPHIPDVVMNNEAFTSLPAFLVKEVLMYTYLEDYDNDDADYIPTTKQRFDAFVFWYSQNILECSDQDRREITDSFTFDDFTVEDLLTDVRSSRLFSVKRVDMRVLDILKIKQSRNQALEISLEVEREKTSNLKETIRQKDLLLTMYARALKDHKMMIKEKDDIISTLQLWRHK